MTLNELLNQFIAKSGYVYHKLKVIEYDGLVKNYVVWMEKNNKVKEFEVKILVMNEGEANEDARIYEGIYKDPTKTFESELRVFIEDYQINHPELVYYEIPNMNESQQASRVFAYIYNSGTDKISKIEYLAYKIAGQLTFKEVKIV